MSALGSLAAGAVAGVWKIAALLLLAALLAVMSAGGTGWWLAARARDSAQADLSAERLKNAACGAAVTRQNEALDALAAASREARERGLAARQQAAAGARRFDSALARVAAAKAHTCEEAMPAVNTILEAIR
jgi:hypothetical protein